MALLNRNRLKNFFKRGVAPNEEHFSNLIDSSVNKVDEGFNITPDEGLILAPQGSSNRLLSFYEEITDERDKAAWIMSLISSKEGKGLNIAEGVREKKDGESRLFLQRGGNVGIGSTDPKFKLDVNGTVGMKGRIGTYKVGTVDADGKWHDILFDLDDLQAFEVMAEVRGIKGRGRYALLHAIAISTFGRSRNKIRTTQAHFGGFVNRLKLRWKAVDVHSYKLQIKTRSNYGPDEYKNQIKINYSICRLWGTDDVSSEKGAV